MHEGFDLAIRVGELPDSRLAARRIGELQYGLFASPGYLMRRGVPKSPDDLAQHDLLVFSAGSHRAGRRLSRHNMHHRVDAPARLRVNNSFAVRDTAIEGLGIALLPLLVAHAAHSSGALVRVLPEWDSPPIPIHALFPSSRYLTPKMRAFIDLAVAAYASEAGLQQRVPCCGLEARPLRERAIDNPPRRRRPPPAQPPPRRCPRQ